jgi:hypothetical protein
MRKHVQRAACTSWYFNVDGAMPNSQGRATDLVEQSSFMIA